MLAMDLEAKEHERTTVVIYRAEGLKTNSPVAFSIVRDLSSLPAMPIAPPKLEKKPAVPEN